MSKKIVEKYYENGMHVEVLQSGGKNFYKNGKLVKQLSPKGSVWTLRQDGSWDVDVEPGDSITSLI